MLKILIITANRTIHSAEGPVPTTTGKGPMNITAPKSAEPERTAATTKIMMPARIMKKPMKNRTKDFGSILDSSLAEFEEPLKISNLLLILSMNRIQL